MLNFSQCFSNRQTKRMCRHPQKPLPQQSPSPHVFVYLRMRSEKSAENAKMLFGIAQAQHQKQNKEGKIEHFELEIPYNVLPYKGIKRNMLQYK